jgi:hypothetical protein
MGDAFDEMIVVATVAELQAQGHLVHAEHIGPTAGRKRTSAEGMAQLPEVMYDNLCKAQRRTLAVIFFFENVGPAVAFSALLNERGYRAACIHGKTPKKERDAILARYQAGDLDALVNCDCLTEGTDLPRTEVVCVARGCSTWGTWIQMGGRALRPFPGKRRAFILDPFGHTYEHGLLSDAPAFSLEGRATSITQPLAAIRSCKACGCAFRPPAVICPRCGAAVPPPPAPKVAARPASTGTITAAQVVNYQERWEAFLHFMYIAVLNGHKRAAAGVAYGRDPRFKGQWPPFKKASWDEAERIAKERINAADKKAS